MGSLGRGQEEDTRPRPSIKDIRDIDNIMALVTREAQALESRLEWDLASRCSNYQQLLILKKNQGIEKGIQSASSCAGMTPSERLIWYRANQPAVELDAERCNQSSNYRQLMLARGVRAIEETEEEQAESLCWLGEFGQLRKPKRSKLKGLQLGRRLSCGTEQEAVK